MIEEEADRRWVWALRLRHQRHQDRLESALKNSDIATEWKSIDLLSFDSGINRFPLLV